MIGYGSVHFGKSLLWAGEDALALYILVRFVELPPALAGGLFLASALWNALCDALVGAAIHLRPAFARRLPLVAAAATLICGVSFAALPLVAKGNAGAAILLLFLFRTGFCLADLPHNMLTRQVARMQGDLGIARLRSAGASFAALAVAAAAIPLLDQGGVHPGTVALLVGGIGLLAVLAMLPLPFLLLTERDAHTAQAAPAPRLAERYPGFPALCLATIIGLGGLAATGKAMLHLDFGLGGTILLLLTSARLAAVWIWPPVARRIGNHRALAVAYVASGLSAPLLVPAAGQQAAALWLFLLSLPAGGVALLTWAALSETLGQRGPGPAQDGDASGPYAAAFGLFTMSMKTGLGLSAAITGMWLSGSRQVSNLPAEALGPLAQVATLAALLAAAIVAGPAARPLRRAG